MQCEAITFPASPYELRHDKGGQCTRKATYTNGARSLCKQHAKEFATVTSKATNKIRPGYYPIDGEQNANRS